MEGLGRGQQGTQARRGSEVFSPAVGDPLPLFPGGELGVQGLEAVLEPHAPPSGSPWEPRSELRKDSHLSQSPQLDEFVGYGVRFWWVYSRRTCISESSGGCRAAQPWPCTGGALTWS